MKKKLAVLGAGAWGTAIATVLADNGHDVVLWSFERTVVDDIKKTGVNQRFLPSITLAPSITVTNDILQAISDVDIIFEAVPVAFLRSTLKQCVGHVSPTTPWVILSKGIENETLMLPSAIVQDVLGAEMPIAVVAGPNFAHELARKAYSATIVASNNTLLRDEVSGLLANSYFIVYPSQDLIGVQVGGAVKNVLAIAIGIARGANLAENTIAYFLTVGMQELATIIELFGGQKETAISLAGLGDVVLTCLGSLSKNLCTGKMIGEGKSIRDIAAMPGMVLPEGINTVKSLDAFAAKKGVTLPLCRGTYECIFEGKPVEVLLENLRQYPTN